MTTSSLAPGWTESNIEVLERVRKRWVPSVLEHQDDPQQTDLHAGETEQESDVSKRPGEDPQALSRNDNHLEHDPGTKYCAQDASEQAPVWTISGPGEVDSLRNVDLIPSGPHEKSKAIRSVDQLLAQGAIDPESTR